MKTTKTLITALCYAALMAGCSVVNTASQHDGSFKTDVINMDQAKLTQDFWLDKLPARNKVVMDSEQIRMFNQSLIANNRYVVNPLNVPNQLKAPALRRYINSISKAASSARYYYDGTEVTPEDYLRYRQNANFDQIDVNNKVQYAVVVARSALRTFPTLDKIYKRGKDRDLDRFQESAVFPGEALAVLHTSADKQWSLVQNYHYIAWMQTKDLAIGEQAQIKAFMKADDFIVVSGAMAFTNFVPQRADISNVQLDMGTRLPLVAKNEVGNLLNGQNTYANYIVRFPTRDKQGKLKLVAAAIAKSQDISVGYLPYTQRNVIKQAFKFLGERYGWGHDYNGRDCTGFVGEIYKSFGLKMPRNTSQQGKGTYGTNVLFDRGTPQAAKQSEIDNMSVGDLLYISGHVMMYIGHHDDQPYIIHDVHGLSYFKPDGRFYRGKLNGVSVTPLWPMRLSEKTSYVDNVYNIKTINSGVRN